MNLTIPKPEGSTWTDDQWQAIITEGSDILVAAAAGSGKTAVLVERIIRKISSDTDVDRLLVATFTKAAASEMKERIRLALEKALDAAPSSEHLRRQLALLARANITTLHSFCLDVIRRYYPLIGLDPGFRVANETESELLRLDVLDSLFEQRYSEAEEDSAFVKLADHYGGEKGDDKLYMLTQKLYDFSRSQPWPEKWLEDTAANFVVHQDEASLSQSIWVKSLEADVRLAVQGAIALLDQALELTAVPCGPTAYAVNLHEDLEALTILRRVVEEEPWGSWREAFLQQGGFGRLKAIRGDEHDKDVQEQVKALRDQAKGIITGLTEELFTRPLEAYLEELHALAPLMKALAELVIDFGREYEVAKRTKGLLDFGDLEHLCLRILRDPSSTSEQTAPSAAALEYQAHFVEILLDEYQDTNRVQEAIVELISAPGRGNRFMVGDVKQSIYRFRLAEPGLFLHKYKIYEAERTESAEHAEAVQHHRTTMQDDGKALQQSAVGKRIDLARNFRSRNEVVDGVNDVFRALMRERVAEMDYDKRAELVRGAEYPPSPTPEHYAVELALIDRGAERAGEEQAGGLSSDDEDNEAAREAAADLQTAQLEARYIARRIKELKDSGFTVYDSRKHSVRPLAWRDIVILLRSHRQWSPILIEELQQAGIPAFAELSTGYFEAIEVEVMLSLLRIIDNPYQDIPLAGALRSPLFGLTAEELALIRIEGRDSAFYDALVQAEASLFIAEETRNKLRLFLDRLHIWRTAARQGSVADLIWSIYQETGYADWVGGLVGGTQRQANLRALHERARQYESTTLRGLFRFLRFIERMRESGGDLGTAGALGEGEDVVRIMSIHKSKGLEFPVVFVAGLGKMFNQQDVKDSFLMHKDLGFGPKFVAEELRITYPSLPYHAIRRRMRLEMQAEELRVLYVALTRPKEKMILVGTASDAAKQISRWEAAIGGQGVLPDYSIVSARRFLDWLGPLAFSGGIRMSISHVVPSPELGLEAAASVEVQQLDAEFPQRLQAVAALLPQPEAGSAQEVDYLLNWRYPFQMASSLAAKTTITEMKRGNAELLDTGDAVAQGESPFLGSLLNSGTNGTVSLAIDRAASRNGATAEDVYTFRLRRPRFMENQSFTPAERGTVAHTLMQHVPFVGHVDQQQLQEMLTDLVARKILTERQAAAADLGAITSFFQSELGLRLLQSEHVQREVPFSCTFPADRVYPNTANTAVGSEEIMIQGVIDCLFEEGDRRILLDYKTDHAAANDWQAAAEKHRFQLELYAEALLKITGKPVDEIYVFFLNGSEQIKLL